MFSTIMANGSSLETQNEETSHRAPFCCWAPIPRPQVRLRFQYGNTFQPVTQRSSVAITSGKHPALHPSPGTIASILVNGLWTVPPLDPEVKS